MARAGNRAGWGSLVAGIASVAALPLAVFSTRFSDSYDLLHAGFAIPVSAALGLVALGLARRAHRSSALSLAGTNNRRVATAGRVLGVVGLCLAASASIALGVYWLLEYVGSRD